MIPQTFKKIIPLLAFLLTVFAFAAQSLLATPSRVQVHNQTDEYVFFTFSPEENPFNITIDPKQNISKTGELFGGYDDDSITYVFGLIMGKYEKHNEISDGMTQQPFKNDISMSSLTQGHKETSYTKDFHTSKTVNGEESFIKRDFELIFAYDKNAKQLNITVKGTAECYAGKCPTDILKK